MVDWDEQIKAHMFWVWGEERGFLKRGKEGMLVITDRRLAFITKTEMKYPEHSAHSRRQLNRFRDGENVLRPAEGYDIKDLEADLDKSPDNLEVPYRQILDINQEEKEWGSVLNVKINLGDKTKTMRFSIVRGWVKYPAKDPIEFQRLDWSPVITLVKTSPS